MHRRRDGFLFLEARDVVVDALTVSLDGPAMTLGVELGERQELPPGIDQKRKGVFVVSFSGDVDSETLEPVEKAVRRPS